MTTQTRAPKFKTTVAEYLTHHIDALVKSKEKTQKQISDEIGYTNQNIITMFKQGRTPLPLNKVGPMARSINVDPVYLLRMVMSEYTPETYVEIEPLLSKSLVTNNERQIIDRLRQATGNTDPQLIDEAQGAALQSFADTLLANQPK
jgi:hypothetical protein